MLRLLLLFINEILGVRCKEVKEDLVFGLVVLFGRNVQDYLVVFIVFVWGGERQIVREVRHGILVLFRVCKECRCLVTGKLAQIWLKWLFTLIFRLRDPLQILNEKQGIFLLIRRENISTFNLGRAYSEFLLIAKAQE